jgi:hypothetical protein
MLGSVVALLVASMPAAVADTQLFVRSEPNGDISASAQSVADVGSDKDKDGDPDTLTQADNHHIFFSVFNQAEFRRCA